MNTTTTDGTPPRWYCVNNMGMATLCADQADAEMTANDCNIQWPRQGPHRAVQLVEASALDTERAARQEAQAMAECLDMLRTDLISAGVVGPEVAPMFLTEAVLSAVSRERTARQEAQQRIADMQELAAKAGLAHRMAVQRCVQAAVSEAVAAEREACAVVCEGMHEEDRPSDYADAIRARGAA